MASSSSSSDQYISATHRDNVVIAKVDADQERSLGEKFEVQGFPTLKWFPKGQTKPENYEGPRDAPGIVKWINGKTGGLTLSLGCHAYICCGWTWDDLPLSPPPN